MEFNLDSSNRCVLAFGLLNGLHVLVSSNMGLMCVVLGMLPCKYLQVCVCVRVCEREKQAQEELGESLWYAQALYARLWLGTGSGAGPECR